MAEFATDKVKRVNRVMLGRAEFFRWAECLMGKNKEKIQAGKGWTGWTGGRGGRGRRLGINPNQSDGGADEADEDGNR